MKRLTIALLIAAAFSAPAFAITPVERDMNDFNGVSQPKYAPQPQHSSAEEAAGAPRGYNKAIEEHKLHMAADNDEGRPAKPGQKPHHKKHPHKPTPASK